VTNLKGAFALPLVLVMILICSIVGISAVTLFSERGNKVKSTFARKQAVIAAESGFNWAVSKLLQDTIGKRWYAFGDGDDCVTISSDNGESTIEVFLCDVFNDRGELAHVHILAKGSYSIPSTWKSKSAICFGTVQITGNEDNLSAVILEKRILDSYRFSDLVTANDELFSAAGNKFANGQRIFFDNSTYGSSKEIFLQIVRRQALEEVDVSDSVVMRPVVALLEKYIQILNEIRLARVANSLLRTSNFSDIFKLASETNLSLSDLVSTLRAIEGKGEAFSSDRAIALKSKITRSQRELLIVYLLLKRIKELSSTSEIYVKGIKYPPKDGALKIAGLFYEKMTGEQAGDSPIESMFDKLLQMGKQLNETNVMRTFFSVLDSSTKVVHGFASLNVLNSDSGSESDSGGGTQTDSRPSWWSDTVLSDGGTDNATVPVRDSLIEVARAYDWNSSRIPYGSHEGLFALDEDISDVEFERSVSSLNIYNGESDSEKRSRKRVKTYINDEVAENGEAGFLNATIKAGILGMDDQHKEDYLEVLQESAVEHDILLLNVYVPSSDIASNSEDVGTVVEDLQLGATSTFKDGDAVENPFSSAETDTDMNVAGSGNPVVNENRSNEDNTTEGVMINAAEDGTSGELFIEGGTLEQANELLNLFNEKNPDSNAVIDINEITGGSGSGTTPSSSGSNLQVSDTALTSLENDYLNGNDIDGDDAWMAVGTCPSCPVISDEPVSPPPAPPSGGNNNGGSNNGGNNNGGNNNNGADPAAPATDPYVAVPGGDAGPDDPPPDNNNEWDPNEGASDTDAKGDDAENGDAADAF